MYQKAEKLSQIQNAFNPNPLESKEELKEFYLKTSEARTGDKYSDFVETTLQELSNSTEVYQHKLFIGHPGCGKTTELYQLLQKTKEVGFVSCFGRCDVELDSADIEYTDVLFLILDLLVQMSDEYGIEFDSGLIQSIHDYWKQDIDLINHKVSEKLQILEGDINGTAGLKGILSVMARLKGVIKNSSESRKQIRQHIEPGSSELVNKIPLGQAKKYSGKTVQDSVP